MIQKPQGQSEFFNVEYLTNKLKYEVEFLDVTRAR